MSIAVTDHLCRGFALALLFVAGAAQASSIYEETVLGDLSDDGNAPTFLDMSPGSNVVGGDTSGADNDFFTFTLEAGESLDAIVLVAHTPSASSSFLGAFSGATYADLSNLAALGYVNFSSGDVSSDLLPDVAASNGNFSGPLGPGDYSFWVDEGSVTPETWRFDFQISAVPEPASGALTALGLVALAARSRLRRSSAAHA